MCGINAVKVLNRGSTEKEEWDRIWDDISALINECCQICNIELSAISKRFLQNVQECKYIETVKGFPDNWGSDQKACYLYHMVSGAPFPRYVMRSKINEDSGLQWPKGNDGKLLPVIKSILCLKCNMTIDAEGRWVSKYNTQAAFDYVQVFRNHHKHFDDLPENIKVPFLFSVHIPCLFFLNCCPCLGVFNIL